MGRGVAAGVGALSLIWRRRRGLQGERRVSSRKIAALMLWNAVAAIRREPISGQ